jgi:hypothetical protein
MDKELAFQAEVGGYSQQKNRQIKIVLYADEVYAGLIARMFPVGTQVGVAGLIDPTTGEIRE